MKKVCVLAAAVWVAALAAGCSRADADTTITTEVRAKLDSDRIVTNPARIQVQTSKKVVTLSGSVASPTEADQAIKLAKSTEGVKNVVNNLTVTPGAPAAAPPGPPAEAPTPASRS